MHNMSDELNPRLQVRPPRLAEYLVAQRAEQLVVLVHALHHLADVTAQVGDARHVLLGRHVVAREKLLRREQVRQGWY